MSSSSLVFTIAWSSPSPASTQTIIRSSASGRPLWICFWRCAVCRPSQMLGSTIADTPRRAARRSSRETPNTSSVSAAERRTGSTSFGDARRRPPPSGCDSRRVASRRRSRVISFGDFGTTAGKRLHARIGVVGRAQLSTSDAGRRRPWRQLDAAGAARATCSASSADAPSPATSATDDEDGNESQRSRSNVMAMTPQYRCSPACG